MKPLVDADVLLYEVGFACEYGKEEIPSFEYAKEIMDARIEGICKAVNATEKPALYLTGKGNFRENIAKRKEYKGNRKAEKPFHYPNLKVYLIASYGATVVDGMEADDAMAIAQWNHIGHLKFKVQKRDGTPVDLSKYKNDGHARSTIICTRDKDLRMVPGWHYGWESGKQGEFGPEFVDEIGYLKDKGKKVVGTGLKFFYYQLLVGDSVDNIPGCPGVGPKKAYNLLCDLETEEAMYQVVREQYEEKYEEGPLEELLEQAQLLWMIREVDEDGKPIMWQLPNFTLES